MPGLLSGSMSSSPGSNPPPQGDLLIGTKSHNSFGSGKSGRKSYSPNKEDSSIRTNSNYGVALIEEATIDAENEEDTPLSKKVV